MILTQPFGAYYPNIQVGVGKYAHTQCCYCAQSELVTWPHYPIRTVGFFNSSFLENINPTFKWDWANKPKLIVVVVPRSSNQTWRVFYLTSWVNLLKVGLIWFRIYTCWNVFLSYGPILNSLYWAVQTQPAVHHTPVNSRVLCWPRLEVGGSLWELLVKIISPIIKCVWRSVSQHLCVLMVSH